MTRAAAKSKTSAAPLRARMRAIKDIKQAAVNPRIHSERQLNELAQSIRRFGFTAPVLIDQRDVLIAGHARLEAAKRAGLERVPAITADERWSARKRREYLIFDNRIAELANWRTAELTAALTEMRDGGFDFRGTGFTADDLKGERIEALQASDAAPAPGKVVRLGKHRLMVGDSTNLESAAKLMAGVKADLLITDPPYGVRYDANWRAEHPTVKGDKLRPLVTGDQVRNWSAAYSGFTGAAAYIFHTPNELPGPPPGMEIKGQCFWIKEKAPMGRGYYHWQHETAAYCAPTGKAGDYRGKGASPVWRIAREQDAHNHPTSKPVELMATPMRISSKPGQVIHDPFIGSGSTLIAAEREGRVCYGMDVEAVHIETTIRRWEAETGKSAKW